MHRRRRRSSSALHDADPPLWIDAIVVARKNGTVFRAASKNPWVQTAQTLCAKVSTNCTYRPSIMATSSRPDESVEKWIEDNLQKQVVNVQTIGRSSWSSQYCYVTRDAAFETHRYFVKTAPASKKEMFHSESIGLNALHRLCCHLLEGQ